MTSHFGVDPVLAMLVRLGDAVPEPDDVTPGWVYPVIFFALFAVTILLWLSMRKQLKKIRFEEAPDPAVDPPRSGDSTS